VFDVPTPKKICRLYDHVSSSLEAGEDPSDGQMIVFPLTGDFKKMRATRDQELMMRTLIQGNQDRQAFQEVALDKLRGLSDNQEQVQRAVQEQAQVHTALEKRVAALE
jgi:hypothetical protein